MLIFISCLSWKHCWNSLQCDYHTFCSYFYYLSCFKNTESRYFHNFFRMFKEKDCHLTKRTLTSKNMTESIELLIFTQTDEPNIRSLDGYLQRRKTLAFMANSFFSVSFSKNSPDHSFHNDNTNEIWEILNEND